MSNNNKRATRRFTYVMSSCGLMLVPIGTIKQKEGSKLLAKNIITKRSGYEQKEMRLKE